MEKKGFSYDDDGEDKNVPYDLRQIYARLVGEHMLDVSINRRNQSFFKWYRALQNLYTITSFKYNDKEVLDKKYEDLKKRITILSNKYKSTWLNQSHDANQTETIDMTLRELENFIYVSMEDGGIFGKGYEYDEDEI